MFNNNFLKGALILSYLWVTQVLAVAVIPATDAQQMYKDAGLLSAVPTLFPAPIVAFTDLITGPDTGLGDGFGSGVIVTVWGQRLGSVQGTNTIKFCDSGGTCRAPYVYYWKNADGTLPSGPANLYESHGMQEIAFSVPDSAQGVGSIRIITSEGTSDTPFTVRAGGIYHVKSTGNDTTGNGSFANPYLTLEKVTENGISVLPSGSTVYVHDNLQTTNNARTGSRGAVYYNDATSSSSLAAQYGIIAYPNSQPVVEGVSGFANYNTSAMVISKFDIKASNCEEDVNGQPINCSTATPSNISYGIQTSAWGRTIGNNITDRDGHCASATQGAISGNQTRVEGYVAFGNQIHDYGCAGSSYQHHTMYLSIRDTNNPVLEPIEVSWNYLKDNQAKNGLHYFDEDASGNNCGQFSGTMKWNNNVVVNQAGAGIFLGVYCKFDTTVEYKNNILINTGLKSSWDGQSGAGSLGDNNAISLTPDGDQTSTINFENNTIIGWNNDDDPSGVNACLSFNSAFDNINVNWNGNVCIQESDKPFVGSTNQGDQLENNVTGSNNAWYTSASTKVNAIVPTWDSAPVIADPLVTVSGSRVVVNLNSPLLKKTKSSVQAGIYGEVRQYKSTIGAVQ